MWSTQSVDCNQADLHAPKEDPDQKLRLHWLADPLATHQSLPRREQVLRLRRHAQPRFSLRSGTAAPLRLLPLCKIGVVPAYSPTYGSTSSRRACGTSEGYHSFAPRPSIPQLRAEPVQQRLELGLHHLACQRCFCTRSFRSAVAHQPNHEWQDPKNRGAVGAAGGVSGGSVRCPSTPRCVPPLPQSTGFVTFSTGEVSPPGLGHTLAVRSGTPLPPESGSSTRLEAEL